MTVRDNRRDEVARRKGAAHLFAAIVAMMRDADRPVRADGDEMERRLDAAALEKLGDEGREPLLVVRTHRGEYTPGSAVRYDPRRDDREGQPATGLDLDPRRCAELKEKDRHGAVVGTRGP